MTTDDDNATTWRHLADQLTPEQIARFEHAEQICMTGAHLVFPQNDRSETLSSMLKGVLKEARWEAQQNLTDAHTYGHVPLPAGVGVESAEHWEADDTGTWTRRLSVSSRTLDRPGADSTVYVDGVQSTDGTVEWSLYVLADEREPMTADQARHFAAMLTEAADELDGLR
jgi:hypothetical protein